MIYLSIQINFIIIIIILGFIGKGMTRHLNRVWNYLIKGILGTLTVLIVFPILCLSVSLGSLIVALTGPFW